VTNILENIVAAKRIEVEKKKSGNHSPHPGTYFERKTISLAASILDDNKTGIITEFKRRSPSKGIINASASVQEVTSAYTKFGASGLSILTDQQFFGGSKEDLEAARTNPLPILQKDFIIDGYQLVEARAIGADAILLIAACLETGEMQALERVAQRLGMAVLVEVHDAAELEAALALGTPLIGINNRNLNTFETQLETTLELLPRIPGGRLLVTESGILSPADVRRMREAGVRAFLVGEAFMRSPDPGAALIRLFTT